MMEEKEKDKIVWHSGIPYSAEEWKIRSESWQALQDAKTIEERKAILEKARKELRSLPKTLGQTIG